MTGDDWILGLFLLLPVVCAASCYLFFVRFGLHRGAGRRVSRLVAGNVLVFGLVVSLPLPVGEAYYRFFYDTTDSFGLTKTSRRWFERHWRFNQAQVRDSVARYDPAVRPGARRVTFLGDSFTAGHGVADVERRFANLVRARRPDWEIQVMAWSGVETGEELAALSGTASFGYELDVVVLVYVLNDVSDLIPGWKETYARLARERERGRFLLDHSWLINTWYYRLRARAGAETSSYFDLVHEAYTGESWEEQRARLRAILDEVRGRGGRLLVVTFPFLHATGEDYAFADVHDRLDRTWEEWNVPHLDLLTTYSAYAPSDLVVNPYDAHPNEQAHRIAADAMLPFIERHMGRREQP